ncbi:hypothetical protein D3C76_1505180 [compost metagenome]
MLIQPGERHRLNDAVNLLLVHLQECLLRSQGTGHQTVDFLLCGVFFGRVVFALCLVVWGSHHSIPP